MDEEKNKLNEQPKSNHLNLDEDEDIIVSKEKLENLSKIIFVIEKIKIKRKKRKYYEQAQE